MRSRFGLGLKTLLATAVLICIALQTARAQDEAAGDQLLLELRQVRTEVDFLRTQVETGGGVADVRFNDLQRRIDKVLEDAAALATQASTAQRKAETAVQRVEDLEGQVSVMQASIDQIVTRLASLEADAVFALEQEEEPAVAEAAETESSETAETDGGSSAALETPVLTELLDADGVPVPLPKDRTIIAPPSREVTTEVEVADATAEVINVPQTEAPTLAAVEGASRLGGSCRSSPVPALSRPYARLILHPRKLWQPSLAHLATSCRFLRQTAPGLPALHLISMWASDPLMRAIIWRRLAHCRG